MAYHVPLIGFSEFAHGAYKTEKGKKITLRFALNAKTSYIELLYV